MTPHSFGSGQPDVLQGAYHGEKGALFKLALRTGFLSLITLGIYRFWAKTRIRRYMWSATAPGGAPFEYTGTGLEKFLGFLVAMVVLAIYLGVVQMGLFLVGLSVFSGGTSEQAILAQVAGTYITFFALLPLLYLARYRGRRYLLSRTRWRGIRFGAEKGAVGYMLRGLGYTVLSMVTLGILIPLQMFRLEKYMADRTYYGTARMTQNGKWTMLYGPMKHLLIGVLILIGGSFAGGISGSPVLAFLGIFVGYIWVFVGAAYFGVHSFNRLTAHKELEGGIGFTSAARTGKVIWIYFVGGLISFGIAAVFAIPIVMIMAGMMATSGNGLAQFGQDMFSPASIVGLIGMVLAYLAMLVVMSASALTFIIQPVLCHYIEQVTILNAPALDSIRQRAADNMTDAEGFADALDVGGGF